MIPRAAITEWATRVPWPTPEQIEQDLLLSRLIVAIARDDYLSNELIFRGGTCLHKLHMDQPRRYSEDLDYVRRTGGGIADLTRAATRIGEALGMEVRTRITEQPKIYLRAPFESGGRESDPIFPQRSSQLSTATSTKSSTPSLARQATNNGAKPCASRFAQPVGTSRPLDAPSPGRSRRHCVRPHKVRRRTRRTTGTAAGSSVDRPPTSGPAAGTRSGA